MKSKGNRFSYFTREEVEFFAKPFFTGHKWIGYEDDELRILLTRSRCKALGYPVAEDELPTAYRFTNNGPAKTKYVPVFDRSGYDLDEEELFIKEIYPFIKLY